MTNADYMRCPCGGNHPPRVACYDEALKRVLADDTCGHGPLPRTIHRGIVFIRDPNCPSGVIYGPQAEEMANDCNLRREEIAARRHEERDDGDRPDRD